MYADNRASTLIRRVVGIRQVDPETFSALGDTPTGDRCLIDLSVAMSGAIVIPKVGDEWLVEKWGSSWILVARTSWQNPAITGSYQQGDVIFTAGNRIRMHGGDGPFLYTHRVVDNPPLSSANRWLEVVDPTDDYVIGYMPIYPNMQPRPSSQPTPTEPDNPPEYNG